MPTTTTTPTLVPTPQPTAIIDETTPAGVTATYLNAWKNEDFDKVRQLTSQHSIDALNVRREELTFTRTGVISYSLGKTIEILGVPDTVRVEVNYESEAYINDCCILHLENGSWMVNLTYKLGKTSYSIADYKVILAAKENKPIKNVSVQLTKLLVFPDFFVFEFAVENMQDKCIHAGTNGLSAIAYFGNQPKRIKGSKTFERRFLTANEGVLYLIIVPRKSEELPTSIELLDWQLDNTFFPDCQYGTGDKWSYPFDLEYQQ